MQVGIMRNDEAPMALRGEMAERIISRAYGKAPVTVQQDIRIEARVALDGIDVARLALMEATLIDALGKEKPPMIADQGLEDATEAEYSEVTEDTSEDGDDHDPSDDGD